MSNIRIEIGKWRYVPSNETVEFCGQELTGYDIDLERGSCAEWLHNLAGKSWITSQDLSDLKQLFAVVKAIKPDLAIYRNKPPSWLPMSRPKPKL
jgi:hypothetical protein